MWRLLQIPLNAKLVKVPNFSRWTVIPARPQYYADIVRVPDKHLSSIQAANEVRTLPHWRFPIFNSLCIDPQFWQAELTLYTDEIGDNIQVPVIQNILNRSLGDLIPLVHEEAVLAFEDAFPFDHEDDQSSKDGECALHCLQLIHH
jgi:hypothetical protein